MKQTRQPALLVLLITTIVAIGWGGTTLNPVARGSDPGSRDTTGLSVALPTTYPQEPARTASPEPTDAPETTPNPTVVPTEPLTPASEPAETPRPPVPENTFDQSYIVERGESGRMEVALTFDAGEGAGFTSEILDFLAANNIKGSFGITGEWAREHPKLVQRIVDDGHHLFNHTDSHRSWTGVSTTGEPLSPEDRIAELERAERTVQDETGYSMKPYFRPPYGDYDVEGLELLKEQGYEYTLWWTCDSLGWNGATAAEVVERCGPDADGGGPGAIVLMHVAQENDYLALDELVEAYRAAGYDFVTMEQMIQP
ncbi:MAG TPA: polysaccharide deacetylase family protein [Thermomicrobiales bacterium]|nr:polysaccharide deacetylase family protein [Thermomicrobiales bacterium]